jgi:hypothetical protein
MAVTHTFGTARDQCFQEIERLTNSHSLRGSESLCRLLHYLAEHSLAQPPSTVKEYQIATEVFGRPANFDPQSDSTVRVQAGRLRVKLAEYYASEGVDDTIVVKLPKGSYHLSFEGRSPDGRSANAEHVAVGPGGASHALEPASNPWRPAALLLSGALFITLLALALVLRFHTQPTATGAAIVPAASPTLRVFWKPFLSGPEEPLVIFSNAAFVGRPETGLRYFRPQTDPKAAVHDHYTGVGEVLAVHSLDQVFGALGRRIVVKRGSLLSLDDAKNTDLIFVGSPSENLSLLDIPGTKDFVFQRLTSGPRQGDLAIVNRSPQPGEATTFLASRSDDPLVEDYAVVGLVPGLAPERSILILAGTTTFGTQGAVEFVSRPDSVAQLLKRLPEGSSGPIKPFEALLHVKIARGVPVETELVAAHSR